MRIPLQTDLISRDGIVSKDARLLNCFVEVSGDQSAVSKRPAVNSDLVSATGVGQGGIESDSKVYAIFGDVLKSYDASFNLVGNITL